MSTKVKTRFTTLDVTAMVTELRSKLTGMRINNIYDLNLKTYVFKLGKSEQKDFLVLESGVRFHTTSVSSEKNKIPTPFTMKLRKYLRDKRLENIQQVGVERVVDFTFGRDENETHIILELYASGNLILTDSQYRILALLRSHEFTEEVKTAVGEVYPFEHAANLKLESFRTDKEYIEQLINQEPSGGKEEEAKIAEKKVPEEPQKDNKTKKNQKQKGQENKENKDAKNKEKSKKNVRKLKDILFLLLPCLHQALVDQILRDKNLNPNTKAGEEHITPLQEIANETIEFLKAFPTKKQVGYLSYKETKPEEDQPVGTMNGKENVEPKQNEPEGEAKAGDKSAVGSQSFVKYLEFSPIPLKSGDPVKEIDSFDKSVDEFFTKQQVPDAQKGENDKKRIAWKKFENIKNDQDTRMRKLKAEQDECLTKAVLIEHNLKEVDVIINIVGAMVQGGLGWDKIWKMISESKNGGDPFASMITRLKLENDQAVILLKNPDEPQLEPKEVEVDIRVKAFINAERYYQEKKKLEIKEKKTLEASQQALKLAEKAAMAEINHEKQKSHVLITRKTYWFEKFSWFITSENYLVIGGRDAQQNEMLVKKYLKKGDLYMHADIHGAGSVVIKNPSNKPVPKITLEEAAIFTVCRSKAWESKIITSAWWVYDHQVSKTAQSGEYLPTGSFMVRGKKNFLNPSRLEMGFGLLFKIDESSLPRHENDRKVKFEEGEEEAAVAELPAPEQVQEPDQYFITGQERPIIKTYEKPKQQGGKQQKDLSKEKSFVQEEKKSAFNDEDDDEDEFKGLRRGSENKGVQKKGSISEADKNLKNLPAQKVPRGKKAKIQKMKEKYGDQDEDEKEMRLKLTGAKEIKELRDESSEDDRKNKKKDKGKDKDKGKQKGGKQGGDQKPKQQNQGQKGPQHTQGQPQKPKPEAKPQGGERVQAAKPETEVQGEVKKVAEKLLTETKPEEPKKVVTEEPKKEASEEEQEKSSQEEVEETKENELSDAVNSKGDIEGSQVNEEVKEEDLEKEGVPQEGVNEGDELRLLVSNPHPDDVILFCVPVCGPYVTLSNYKYKSKLVPGTLKKGKAVKTVMSVFLAPKDLPENEKKLMKNLGDTELVNAMIGNVKVGAAGLLKIKEKEKKAKEQKKKEYRSQEKKNVDKK